MKKKGGKTKTHHHAIPQCQKALVDLTFVGPTTLHTLLMLSAYHIPLQNATGTTGET